jgi:hypothetical protein
LQAHKDEAEKFDLCTFTLLNKQQLKHDLISLGVAFVNDEGLCASGGEIDENIKDLLDY